eukprot:CAMPEP_0118660246 /NCGR_PEP_ID=MMETSP0785-20121206/15568_1 /TAXON_ID=91992 /ORGANISM="Bolidomonas pacifica, Strain CCMP 1866" /LENGTH=59 /DNA_ID=CAMNT_0006553455 /DNA_START=74 /DNA_END=253 /DNA_ORIENTATION=-
MTLLAPPWRSLAICMQRLAGTRSCVFMPTSTAANTRKSSLDMVAITVGSSFMALDFYEV